MAHIPNPSSPHQPSPTPEQADASPTVARHGSEQDGHPSRRERHVPPIPPELLARIMADDEAANTIPRSDNTHAIDGVWLAIGAGFGLFAVLLIALVLLP